jgi:hypothetical protein
MERLAPAEGPSEYRDLGTAAHFLAALCLNENGDPVRYIRKRIAVHDDARFVAEDEKPEVSVFVVDEEMVAAVRCYVNSVNKRAEGGELFVEVKLNTANVTGEPGGFGTSDAVVINGRTMSVVDLKYGANPNGVVEAEGNKQLVIYALAALDEYGAVYEIDEVELSIHQPRIDREPKVWRLPVAELEAMREPIREAGKLALLALEHSANWINGPDFSYLTPSPEACKWCKAGRANLCPAQDKLVPATLDLDEFEDLTVLKPAEVVEQYDAPALKSKAAAIPLLRAWCDAVEARIERELWAAYNSPAAMEALGNKLVQGKRGNRAWRDEAEAETLMKSMRIKHDEMYDYKLISPTKAEKLAAAETIGKRQWPKLQALITQAEGRPTVAPISDKRPALEIKPLVDEFEDLTAESEFV